MRKLHDPACVLFRILESQRDGIILPRVIQHVAAIGTEDDFEAQLFSSSDKCLSLVSGGGTEKENAPL